MDLYENFKRPDMREYLVPLYSFFRGNIYLEDGNAPSKFNIRLETLLSDPIAEKLLKTAVCTDATASLFFRQHCGNWQKFTQLIQNNEGSVMISAPKSRFVAIVTPAEYIDMQKTITIWIKDVENDELYFEKTPYGASK